MTLRQMFCAILAMICSLSTAGLASGNDRQALQALRAADLRLAVVAQRLVVANAPICKRLMPATGMILHAIDQYPPRVRPAAIQVFNFELPISVEAVVPGSPAEQAGIEPGDALISVNGIVFPAEAETDRPTSATRDLAERTIAAIPPSQELAMRILRHGETRTFTLKSLPACRTRFEVLPDAGMMAHSNGETIQVGSSFLARFDDDALAVAFSHELSHTILGHRASFEAAGIRKDSKALSARDRQLIRQAEDEADRLSLVLLANSGYNPAIAPEFWRTQGRNLGQGLFRSNTHARAKARAQAMEAQLANGSSH